jgi:hypothetical protein
MPGSVIRVATGEIARGTAAATRIRPHDGRRGSAV